MTPEQFEESLKKAKPRVFMIAAMFHPLEGELEEPLLVVGSIDYSDLTYQNVKERCNGWPLWYAVMDWGPQPCRLGEVVELSEPDEKGAIQSMKMIAVPLFQIESLDDVRSLLEKLGAQLSR